MGLQADHHLAIPSNTLSAKFSFKTVKASSSFKINEVVKVSTYQLNHQAITLGYRIEYKGCSVSIITDNAPIDKGNYLGEGMSERAQKDLRNLRRNLMMV